MGIAKDSWETADPLCSIRWINDPFSVRSRLRQTLKLNESEKKLLPFSPDKNNEAFWCYSIGCHYVQFMNLWNQVKIPR